MNSKHVFEGKKLRCSSVLSNFYFAWKTFSREPWRGVKGRACSEIGLLGEFRDAAERVDPQTGGLAPLRGQE